MTTPRSKRTKRYLVQFRVKDTPNFKLNEDFSPIDELKKWIEQELRGLPAGIYAGKITVEEIQ